MIALTVCAAGAWAGAPAEETNPLRILALGDSYTIGEGVEEVLRWPNQLAARLQEITHDDATDKPVEPKLSTQLEIEPPRIIARTGWTTADLIGVLEAEELSPPYDLVTLCIGVNDQYQGRRFGSFSDGFVNLLDRAIAYAGDRPSRVLVLTIPDYTVTPFARAFGRTGDAGELERYNEFVRDRATERGVMLGDIVDISREAADDSSLLADDGLHPSGAMYGRWVEVALPAVIRALGQTSE